MPEMNESEVPATSPNTKKQSERTEAKFYEDVNKLIAEAESAGGDYRPPNKIAEAANLKAKRDVSPASRTAKPADDAADETTRNRRENLFKPLDKDLTRLVAYARSAGKAPNEIAALESVARQIKGARAPGKSKKTAIIFRFRTAPTSAAPTITPCSSNNTTRSASKRAKIFTKPRRTAPGSLITKPRTAPSSTRKLRQTPRKPPTTG